MSEGSLRERLTTGTEDRLGRALSDLLENPILTGAIGRAFDAREKAAQAQELAMGALNLPSAADIERLTRRLRSLSHRIESIEDGVDRLDRTLAAKAAAVTGAATGAVEARLGGIERQLQTLTKAIAEIREDRLAAAGPAGRRRAANQAGIKTRPPGSSKKPSPTRRAAPKPAAKRRAAPKPAATRRAAPKPAATRRDAPKPAAKPEG
ncbi:MAG TPA: hypothetical protein VGY76_07840 [Solirubrobacteraceae bacterium]|jgi:hypothetical protein|nr:hypothetical protein [Solirubrobacteraceae bacterium]